jgi:cytochrome P450
LSQSTQRTHPELQELEWYRSTRDNDPVWRDPETGVWNVFRYQDVATILADYRTFSSDFSEVLPDLAELTEGNILATASTSA